MLVVRRAALLFHGRDGSSHASTSNVELNGRLNALVAKAVDVVERSSL